MVWRLTAGAAVALNGVAISPKSIRFSQTSVEGVQEIAASMRTHGWQGAPIDVGRMADGGLTSVDNTRLLAAHRAGIDVRAVVHPSDEALPADLIQRFTTSAGVPQTWGDAIGLRIGKQDAPFRRTFPSGSPFTGSAE